MSATPHPYRRRRRTTRFLAAAAGVATVGALVAAMPASAGETGKGKPGHQKPGRYQDVQLLSFNDLHGNLEPPAGSSGRVTELQPDGTSKTIDAGGVEYLATHLRQAREGNKYSVTAAGGDMVGASPLISGLFHDEPTIEALNKLDLDVTSVGNHEFDEGAKELGRLQKGGCHPTDGCYVKGKKFKGADFPYLAANVLDEKTKKPILKPYWVWKKNGVKVGFIGVTLEDTPGVVSAEGVKGLKFKDEVETINKYAKELEKQGVKSVVALIHEGGLPASAAYNYDCDSPGARRRHIRPHRGHRQEHHAEGRRAGHRPHPRRVRVHDQRPVGQAPHGHLGRVLRPALHRHDADVRPLDRRHRPDRRRLREPRGHAYRAQGDGHDRADHASGTPSRRRSATRPIGYISGDISNVGTESPMRRPHRRRAARVRQGARPGDRPRADEPGRIRARLTYAAKGA